MAFTRFHDDPCRITKQLQESTAPGKWNINTPGNGLDPGFMEDPQLRLQKWGANTRTNIIDVQSDLMGLTRNLNRDCVRNNMYEQYEAQSEKMNFKSHKPFVDETRATHPAWMYRDLEQTKYAILPLDPQEHVCMPFQNNLDTRILEKDNWKPKIPVLSDEAGRILNN